MNQSRALIERLEIVSLRQAFPKEQARLYLESRLAEVELLNEQLDDQIDQLNKILSETLSVDDFFDLDTLKQRPQIPIFDPGYLGNPEHPQSPNDYLVPDLGVRKFVPGAKEKHAQGFTWNVRTLPRKNPARSL